MEGKFAHELVAGDEYAPLEFVVNEDYNQQMLFAVEDYNPIYLEGRHGQPPVVHPVLLMQMSPRTRSPSYRQAPGMGSAFARDHSVYLGAAHVGTTLRVTWKVHKTYEQRGKIYQDYTAWIRDAAGRDILKRDMSSTFFSLGKVKTYGLADVKVGDGK